MSAGESYGESQGCDDLRVPCTAVGPSRPLDRGTRSVGKSNIVPRTAHASSRYLGECSGAASEAARGVRERR